MPLANGHPWERNVTVKAEDPGDHSEVSWEGGGVGPVVLTHTGTQIVGLTVGSLCEGGCVLAG